MAERVGFEPTAPESASVFETAALSRTQPPLLGTPSQSRTDHRGVAVRWLSDCLPVHNLAVDVRIELTTLDRPDAKP